MNTKWLWLVAAVVCLFVVGMNTVSSQSPGPRQACEYATIWWDGTDNSKLLRPDGTVESLSSMFIHTKRPNNTDERNYYLTLALNTLAKEGWEFAGALNKDIIVKRAVAH